MRIYHNIPALNAYHNLNTTTNMTAKSLEKLSSGLRINRAADDAAGLAISEKMRGQIRGIDQAIRNAQDGISLLQTAEGALTETHAILQRMRELSVQAANDTYTMNDRTEIQKEIDQLKEEIDRIANTTEFNTKKLLDGSAAALVSSDKLQTKIIMRDGLRVVDQFGQKAAGGGNYKLEITATPGQTQVQKTDIFKIKHGGDSVQQLDIDETSGLDHVTAEGLKYGTYYIATDANAAVAAQDYSAISFQYAQGGNTAIMGASINVATSTLTTNQWNGSIIFTVTGVDTAAGTVTYSYQYKLIGITGAVVASTAASTYILTADGTDLNIAIYSSVVISGDNFADAAAMATVKTGDKLIMYFGATVGTGTVGGVSTAGHDVVTFKYDYDGTGTDYTAQTMVNFRFVNDDVLNNVTTEMPFYTLQTVTSDTYANTFYTGSISLTFNGIADSTTAASFVFGAGLGKVASLDTKLEDIDKFWDASGNFLLKDPKTITLIQGDGKQTSITLFSTDTIKDVRDKLNNAIATGLGQKDYITGAEMDKFVNYVTKADSTGMETVEGTFVMKSLIAGDSGKINFIGEEALINALSLTTIQTATENKFEVDVLNAHTGAYVAENVSIAGNLLVGTVHENVDVMFDPNAGIETSYDATTKTWSLSAATEVYTTYVHLADNTQVFQIGANEKQDMSAAIGRMDCLALGINNVLVTDRESAGRSITKLDGAIVKVSSQRSSLGAIQNRLEHTINNLNVASENLTASESRIRDVDMAQEMMNYTKWNILSQAGTAMLAQANMRPQMVLQLLGNG